MTFASRAAVLALLGCTPLWADASFDETVRYTGGSMLEMMRNLASSPMGRMAGGRMGAAFQDQTYTVYLKGSKLARIGGVISTITDLGAGTVTTIDNTRHTYTVMTFDEMKEMMDRLQQRHSQNVPDLQFDVKVDATGNTKSIDGKTAKEFVLTLTANQPTNAGVMTVKSDLWTVQDVPGSQELREFYKKLAAKYQGALSGGGFNPMMGGASKGLAAAAAESLKLEGYPILRTMEVNGVAAPMGPMAAMGGGNNSGSASGPFIQTETHSSNFSTSAVDDSKFTIPADYKQTKSRQ